MSLSPSALSTGAGADDGQKSQERWHRAPCNMVAEELAAAHLAVLPMLRAKGALPSPRERHMGAQL